MGTPVAFGISRPGCRRWVIVSGRNEPPSRRRTDPGLGPKRTGQLCGCGPIRACGRRLQVAKQVCRTHRPRRRIADP